MEKFKEDPPPLFKRWRHWYALVLTNLAVLIIVFYLITKYFE